MKIKECPNPFRCAALGQTRKFKIRDDWEDIKVSVMERAIRARFYQHHDLAEILKRSKGTLLIKRLRTISEASDMIPTRVSMPLVKY